MGVMKVFMANKGHEGDVAKTAGEKYQLCPCTWLVVLRGPEGREVASPEHGVAEVEGT